MRMEFSSFVEADLDAIADYIAQDNPSRAISFLAEIRAKLRAVATHPRLYRLGLRLAKRRALRSRAAT